MNGNMTNTLNKKRSMIKRYDDIRHQLRDIYICGCYTREQYMERYQTGERKYAMELGRLLQYLPQGFLNVRREGGRDVWYCTYPVSDNMENVLGRSYCNKTFTIRDIVAFFLTMQILSGGERLSMAQILNRIPDEESIDMGPANFTPHLRKMTGDGFIVRHEENRAVTYSLADDFWEGFSENELLDIYSYLGFLKNVSPIGMPYYFLHRKLRLYLRKERNTVPDDRPVFCFRHDHRFTVLDNEILLDLLRAEEAGRTVNIRYGSASMTQTAMYSNVVLQGIVHDCISGKQFVITRTEDTDEVKTFRLDRIAGVSLAGDASAWMKDKAAVSERYWCVSEPFGKLKEVVIEFLFDEKKEAFVRDRIIREGHGGTLRRIDRNRYEYRVSVTDTNEMIPWIRSFGERARVVSGEDLERRLADDWRKAAEIYESEERQNGSTGTDDEPVR